MRVCSSLDLVAVWAHIWHIWPVWWGDTLWPVTMCSEPRLLSVWPQSAHTWPPWQGDAGLRHSSGSSARCSGPDAQLRPSLDILTLNPGAPSQTSRQETHPICAIQNCGKCWDNCGHLRKLLAFSENCGQLEKSLHLWEWWRPIEHFLIQVRG